MCVLTIGKRIGVPPHHDVSRRGEEVIGRWGEPVGGLSSCEVG